MSKHVLQMTTDVSRYEWYTPARYIDMVHEVLGKIDFDPSSSIQANLTVQAARYYTVNLNALELPWPAVDTVYMNPPYSRGLIEPFVERYINHYLADGFNQGIVLINNTTDTKYYQALADSCGALCMVNHRIAFLTPDGTPVRNNTRGQTFFYHGRQSTHFYRVFSEIGVCMKRF